MRVAVAVSGGADSLFALVSLLDQGRDVVALHAYFLPPDAAKQAVAESLAGLCRVLGVQFSAVDLSAAFEERVIAPFAAAYAAGLTPNPCSRCNREMKFGLLAEAARDHGADCIATGHYARLAVDAVGRTALFRGADATRDQSYFLSLVPAEALTRVVFPLADRRKADIRAELARRGLTPPLPAESREVCFVPGDDYRAFLLSRHIPLTGEGPVRLADGTVLGRHQGLWRHTVGQRKGLGIAWREPLYVLAKDIPGNALVVGPKAELAATVCRAGEVNALVPPSEWPETVLAQTCYRMRPRPARYGLDGNGLRLDFLEPIARPTPGQVAAVYDASGRLLAGSVIE